MIDKMGGVDRITGVRFNSNIKINGADANRRLDKRDAVNISRFSELVEKARVRALAVPDIRAERVAEVKEAFFNDSITPSADIASAIINTVVKGHSDHAGN